MSEAPHVSVLRDEVVEALAPAPGKLIVDATFGAGGYSRAILARGAEVVVALSDTDYGARMYEARDLEGNHWCFGNYRTALSA